MQRQVQEMTVQWQSYRYLKNNPSLLKPMAEIERKVSELPVYHIPKDKALHAERYLADGDICAISTHTKFQYTSHVGLIIRQQGRAYFAHATSSRDKGRRTLIDKPITDYLHEVKSHAGIIICRPRDLPPVAAKQR